jgi:hypothetical protein
LVVKKPFDTCAGMGLTGSLGPRHPDGGREAWIRLRWDLAKISHSNFG